MRGPSFGIVKTAALVVLLWLAFSNLALAQPTTVPVEADKPFTHAASGFVFPPDVGAFDRMEVTRFDAGGRNLAVGYVDRHARVVMTVYVYPEGRGTLEAQFADVQASVRQAHPRAKGSGAEPWSLKQGEKTFPGLRATFTFSDTFTGQEQELVSQAYLLAIKGHFVKYRVTYPAAKRGVAEKRIETFLETLALP